MKRTYILLSILLLLAGQEAWADKIAQAIVTNDKTTNVKTMYFVYDEQVEVNKDYKTGTVTLVYSGDAVVNDESGADWNSADDAKACTKVIFDASFASVRPKYCKYWFQGFTNLTDIQGLQYLNTSEVISMYSMFGNCALLQTLDVTSFDTQNVTDMSGMFYNCSNLSTLNLASFNTSKVTDMKQMFKDCVKLTTIHVSKLWSTNAVEYFSDMFSGCTLLKGGNYTVYNANKTGKEYARIDVAGTPGYLTEYTATVYLHDNADNTATLTTYNGQTKTVKIIGRTLYKDGSWNTLCLPFNMTAEQVTNQLNPAKLKTLSSATFADGTLTLNFSDATTIEAGKPYIIKWASGGTNITSPEFTNVTISSAAPKDAEGTAANFHGIYAPYSTSGENKKMLYLGADNKVYYPSKSRTINAFRAYFTLNNGIEAGNPASTSALAARAFVLNFDDGETTGITDVKSNSSLFTLHSSLSGWYTVNGCRLSGKPTMKGLYIYNGKKVVVE